jgi:hypothetical protein
MKGHKIGILLFFTVLISVKGFSQITAEKILSELDSLDAPQSYFKIGAGIGNSLFSTENKALNARQISNPFTFMPSMGYFHKSGWSLSATGYLTAYNQKTSFSQFAISPAYEHSNKKLATSISYTRYIISDPYNTSASPIQNDFYANIIFKKKWIRPGISIG